MKKFIIAIIIGLLSLSATAQHTELTGNIRVDLLTIKPTNHPLPILKGYTVTKKKAVLWTLAALSGIAQGMDEAQRTRPTVYEELWGVDKYSFFGSHAWERNYIGNRYWNEQFNRPNKHKTELFANTGPGRDLHHNARVFNVGVVALVGMGHGTDHVKGKWAHTLLDFGISALIHSVASTITYNSLLKN